MVNGGRGGDDDDDDEDDDDGDSDDGVGPVRTSLVEVINGGYDGGDRDADDDVDDGRDISDDGDDDGDGGGGDGDDGLPLVKCFHWSLFGMRGNPSGISMSSVCNWVLIGQCLG